jgi:hypothetical protein
MRFEPRKRPFLIGPHQPAVSGHICGENGGQPAFDAFRGQSGAPQPHGPNGLSALGAHSNGKREHRHSLSVFGFALIGAVAAFARIASKFSRRWD